MYMQENFAFVFAKRKVLIPYITAGDPNIEITKSLIVELAEAGANAIEIGVPFSDSLADGEVIVESHGRALAQKVSLANVFQLIREISSDISVPILLMLSYNLIHNFGIANFAKEVLATGISGYIIPDLPPEECPSSLYPTYLITPTTLLTRQKMIADKTNEFIYLVSTTGVTGTREALNQDLETMITKLRTITNKPIAVGFGISSAKQAGEVARFADGVIIGSALVKKLQINKSTGIEFIKEVRETLDKFCNSPMI